MDHAISWEGTWEFPVEHNFSSSAIHRGDATIASSLAAAVPRNNASSGNWQQPANMGWTIPDSVASFTHNAGQQAWQQVWKASSKRTVGPC